jgi:hypothetical protein
VPGGLDDFFAQIVRRRTPGEPTRSRSRAYNDARSEAHRLRRTYLDFSKQKV